MAEPAFNLDTSTPEPAVRGKQGLYAAAALGLDPATCGPDFSALEHIASQRYANLTQKERYFRGEQHDHKVFDFEQRLMASPSGVQPLMGGTLSATYIALDQRRPCSPYRLTKKIVQGFTALVFGRGSFPTIRVVGDEETQLFAEALVRACRMPNVLLRARNLGGACGTVALSWRFWQGLPRVQVHNARNLVVHEWADREMLIPAHVTELTQYEAMVRIGGKREARMFWRRRDWTPMADVSFVDQEVTGDDPEWIVDEAEGATITHGDGFCHFIWIQNLPDLDGTNIDGECDVEGLHDNLDMVDLLSSVTTSGGAKNLDPTLILGINENKLKGATSIAKGSDNAIDVGTDGKAEYLELGGSSVDAGIKLLDREEKQVQEVAAFVSPDPDKIAAAGTSGAAIELLFAPMLVKGQMYRDQYGPAIERVLVGMIESARRRMPETGEDGEVAYPVEIGEDGEPSEVDFYLALPPRIVEEPVLDADGQPTDVTTVRTVELLPGKGGDVELEWGPFFERSESDKQARATALSTANGGRALLSHQTSVEQYAVENGLDPVAEWKRVKAQLDAEKESQAGMYPPAGMPVDPPAIVPANGAEDAPPPNG